MSRKPKIRKDNIIYTFSPKLEKAGQSALFTAFGRQEVERNNEVTRASSTLLVREGSGIYNSAFQVNKLLSREHWLRSDIELLRITGGVQKLAERLRQGGILADDAFEDWSPDFISGFARSGALKRTDKSSFWTTYPLTYRPAVRAALTGKLPFHCTVQHVKGKVKNRNDWLSMSGSWAFIMGANHPDSVGVLAGILAGGREFEQDGQKWVGVHHSEQNRILFESYGIPYLLRPNRLNRYGHLLVSPFWNALLVYEMPAVFRLWFEFKRRNLGMCPLLPWAFLLGVWGYKTKEVPPLIVVPFLVDYMDLYIFHDIGVRKVREQAFKQFGFSRVDPRLRVAWIKRLHILGVKNSDWPVGKIPLDFDSESCNNGSMKGESDDHSN